MQPQEDKIRAIAHRLWEDAGQPHGRHDEFWLQAERAVRGDEAEYDRALADSFPASDPPGNSGITGPEVGPVTTGNEPVAADPGGTKRTQALRTKSPQTVRSGDRNTEPKASNNTEPKASNKTAPKTSKKK